MLSVGLRCAVPTAARQVDSGPPRLYGRAFAFLRPGGGTRLAESLEGKGREMERVTTRFSPDAITAAILLLRRALLSVAPRALTQADLVAPGILTHAEFITAVRRERARADRVDRPFAVLVVSLRDIPVDRISLVPGLLRDLVRETDEVGWFDGARLGILLPECCRDQADIVAGKIRDRLGDLQRAETVRVYLHGDPCRPPPECPEAAAADGIGAGAGAAIGCALPAGCGAESAGATSDEGAIDGLAEILATPLPPWKRAMDVFGAGTLLMLLSPVMLGVAVAVRRSSPGPVIFRQSRVGLGGRPFTFYKFRTMNQDAEAQKAGLLDRNEASGPVFKIENDPRITPIGRFLRRASLDELPQLYNVLLGNMTLVGPRPPTPNEVPNYRRWHSHRLDVTGGITCTWQVSGRCTIPFEEWMRMDTRYIQNRSPLKDVELLLRTVGAVFSGKGAR